MSEVKSAQITISEHWHDHVHCKTVGKAPRWDPELGVVCACGEVLGWPDPERKETLSAYTKRVASERVDAASAPGRVKGAFGTYGGEQAAEPEGGHYPGSADNAPEPGDYPEPEQQEPPRSDDDPGPDEPEAEVDWGEPPADEPEPEPLVVNHADEAQTESDLPPWGPEPTPVEPPPWEGVDDAPEPDYDSPPWASAANLTPEEAAAASAEGQAAARELIDNPEVGRDLVPYAGTPIMPTEAQELDPLTGRLAPLDPTLPYTPSDVELKIVEILRQLENSELFLRQQLSRLHQATHNHDFRYNLALHQSEKKAQDQRKAEAWLATEKERHEMTEADMLVRALRDSQHNLRAQLSGFQSVARSLAVSMVNALDGRGPATRAVADRLPPEPRAWDR